MALIVHTSGTTGAPQPVHLTLENIQANALGSAVALGLDPAERWLCPLPLSHVGGLMVLLRSAIYATTAVIGPPDRDDVTLASLVPTMLARLLDAAPPGPRLRAVLLGGAPADRALLTRARDAGWPVAPTYGLTQACSQVTVGEVGDVETSGRPLPGVTVALAPDGEILVTGPTVAGGGTLRTGDLGRLDDRGRLIVDRPQGGHDRQRRRERGAGRGRGGAARAPRRRRRRRVRAPAPGVGGGGDRPRGAARADATELELREWAAAAAGRLQGAEDDRGRRRAPAHRVRQAAAEGAGMTPRRPAGRAPSRRAGSGTPTRSARDTMPVSTWMVEAIAPQPGHTILDLAAGIGDTGFLAAELIEPGGTLITSDFVPEMLSAAQRRAEQLGAPQRALPPDRRHAADRPRRRPASTASSAAGATC